ncbi:DNA phosphorothioation-dependent restriction protein DptG [Streptosporangium sandarakinum]
MTDNFADLKRLADQLPGAASGITLENGRIIVPGAPGMDMPKEAKEWLQHQAPAVWPNTPHGEPRPTLLFGIIRDAGSTLGRQPLDGVLREALEHDLPGDSPQQRQALAAAMRSKFWTTAAGGRTRAVERRYLLPLHAQLPLSFQQEKAEGGKTAFGYKMFRGTLLPFLLSGPSGDVDRSLLDQVLAVFTDDRDLTRLDKKVLEIAAEIAPGVSEPGTETLINNSQGVLQRLQQAGGAFCAPSLEQFRRDLGQVLALDLPRRDRIHQLTLLLALHLTTRLYRAALVLSLRLDRCIALFPGGKDGDPSSSSCAVRCCGEPGQCDLSGTMRFRTGSGSFRPVKLIEPCVTSYRNLTSNYLLPLPVTISTANIAGHALQAAGGPALAPADLQGLHDALAKDAALRARFDAVTRLLAVCRRYQLRRNSSVGAQVPANLPGLHVLRLALLESRRTTMRHEGRDVVHQLAKEVRTGRLIASNGNAATFFELDEDMLHLLVRLICGERLLAYSKFLEGLLRYGLAPQNSAEEQRLQSALSRLGMLKRYSDAGESAYVHHSDISNEEDL